MFYVMYLSGLCGRRDWLEPRYECRRSPRGYACVVLVNNREYLSNGEHQTAELAQESAACEAYLICRNFSATNGIGPGQGRQVVQGADPFRHATFYRDQGSLNSGPSSPIGSDTSSERRSSSGRGPRY